LRLSSEQRNVSTVETSAIPSTHSGPETTAAEKFLNEIVGVKPAI
jgi:hypothetical protein